MEDYYENISEISSSPTSVATDAMPHHVASFFEQFNIKERQEIVCYYMKASKDKSTGLVATKYIEWGRRHVEPLPQAIMDLKIEYNLQHNICRDISNTLHLCRTKVKALKAASTRIRKWRKTFSHQLSLKTNKAKDKVNQMRSHMETSDDFICDNIKATRDMATRQQSAGENYGREALRDIEGRIKKYQNDIKINSSLMETKRKMLNSSQKQLKNQVRKHEKNNDLAREVDVVLYKNKVPRNLYYKGSLNGHAARNLLDNSDKINEDMKALFLKIKEEKDPEKCNEEFKESMDTFFENMSKLSALTNEIFSMIGSQNRQYNDDEVNEFEMMVTNFQIMWRHLKLPLTVKFHHIEDHVVPMMKMHRCLGDYGEESIERLHRIINQKHAQFATTRAWEQRYSKILAEDKLKNYPGVAISIDNGAKAKMRKLSPQTMERRNASQEESDRIKKERKRKLVHPITDL